MATRTQKTRKELPLELQRAIEDGELTREQLRQLIEFEANELGLSFDEAVERAYNDTLPKNAQGSDLRLLISLSAARG